MDLVIRLLKNSGSPKNMNCQEAKRYPNKKTAVPKKHERKSWFTQSCI